MKTFEATKTTPGEFLDRFTIVIRKAKFMPEEYSKQLSDFMITLKENKMEADFIYLMCELMMANTDIWNLESDIRKGKEGKLGLEEVGRRALLIRDVNAKRIDTVNKLNELFNVTSKERKFDHASK